MKYNGAYNKTNDYYKACLCSFYLLVLESLSLTDSLASFVRDKLSKTRE